jgi:hypothetical protein
MAVGGFSHLSLALIIGEVTAANLTPQQCECYATPPLPDSCLTTGPARIAPDSTRRDTARTQVDVAPHPRSYYHGVSNSRCFAP